MTVAIYCTTIALVRKVKNPSFVKKFRPISCCTIMPKILSKKMHMVMDKLVYNSQGGFVHGRVIVDNIIISHELVKGYTGEGISPRYMFKVDLQKAYDSLEWDIIEQVLLQLNVPIMFVHWVMVCIRIVSFSIVVNGR